MTDTEHFPSQITLLRTGTFSKTPKMTIFVIFFARKEHFWMLILWTFLFAYEIRSSLSVVACWRLERERFYFIVFGTILAVFKFILNISEKGTIPVDFVIGAVDGNSLFKIALNETVILLVQRLMKILIGWLWMLLVVVNEILLIQPLSFLLNLQL